MSGRFPPEHSNGIRRVQVGCGPHHIRPDWWNVDIRSFPGIDETMDVTKTWRWRGILDYVYGEHFLEHLSLEKSISFLSEAGAALRPGGRIRLSTPSLEWVSCSHFDPFESDEEKRVLDTLKINRAFHGWGHQFLYSVPFLTYLFSSLGGFEEVKFCDYGQSDDPNLRDLERHKNAAPVRGFKDVNIIEARRGGSEIRPTREFMDQIQREYIVHVAGGH